MRLENKSTDIATQLEGCVVARDEHVSTSFAQDGNLYIFVTVKDSYKVYSPINILLFLCLALYFCIRRVVGGILEDDFLLARSSLRLSIASVKKLSEFKLDCESRS